MKYIFGLNVLEAIRLILVTSSVRDDDTGRPLRHV